MVLSRLLVLGELRLVLPSGETVARWPTRKAGELLALLPGPSAARESVGARLWPEAYGETARNRLKQTSALLRHALGASFPLPASEARHLLSRVSVGTDAAAFTDAVRRADRAPDAAGELVPLEEALALWRGPFLAGWESEWIDSERAQWREGRSVDDS